MLCGNTRKIGHELPSTEVVADKFAAKLFSCHEEFPAIPVRNRSVEVQRSGGKLYWLEFGLSEMAPCFENGPDVCPPATRRLKNEVLAVWSPIATTFCGWLVPIRKQRVKIRAVSPNFL